MHFSAGEDCFVRGTEFVPERWTDNPELVLNRAAYAPFGTGCYPPPWTSEDLQLTLHKGSSSCLGRALAVAEMRLVVANLINKYKFSFAPGQSHDSVVEDMRDQFTPLPGTLRLVFERRG